MGEGGDTVSVCVFWGVLHPQNIKIVMARNILCMIVDFFYLIFT